MPILAISDDFVVHTSENREVQDLSITALAGGGFAVVWEARNYPDSLSPEVRSRVFDRDGNPLGEDFRADSTNFNNVDPSITALGDGVLVTWWSSEPRDGSGPSILGRIYGADGMPSGADFLVNTTAGNGQYFPESATLADGRCVVTWQTGDGYATIRGRIFNQDGSPAGSDFVIDGGGQLRDVATLTDGGFAAVWRSAEGNTGSIRARVFDANGVAAGNVITIDSYGGGGVAASAVGLSGERIVVTWRHGNEATSAIRAFDYAGNPLGNEFTINSSSSETTALADGRFVVVWSSDNPGDGDGSAVFARIFGSDCMPSGDEFIVNSTTAGQQELPSVAAWADGRFVVSWESPDTTASHVAGIRARIFDPTHFDGTSGNDTWRGGDFADHIYGGGGDDTLLGHGGDDLLSGDDGNDFLDGGLGADSMFGGTGNDTYYVDNSGDVVSEAGGGGVDKVFAAGSLTLRTGFENLQLAGTGPSNGTGNGVNNVINGNAFANTINGLAGGDVMFGAGGNDTYHVDNLLDRVFEGPGAGTDKVFHSVAFNIGTQAIENLQMTGTGNTSATGGALNNAITGNSGNNFFDGKAGSDAIFTGGGTDTIRFSTALGATNVDRIVDFFVPGDQFQLVQAIFGILPLGGLAAAAFKDLTTGAVDATDRIIYDRANGDLFYDQDGSGGGFAQFKFAVLSNNAVLSSADFVVI